MRSRAIVRRGALVATVAVCVGVFGWLTGGFTTPVMAQTQNMFALHDRTSSQYNKSCTNCHAAVLTETSLNPAIHTAHVTMRQFVPGEGDNVKCRFCHRSVNWQKQVSGSLRKSVDVRLCRLCHGDDHAVGVKQFYQVGLRLNVDLDGAGYYTLICDGCHGPLTTSSVRGESASKIQSEINENEGGMGPLRVLTPEEIQAIANALATVSGGGD
jgi:hypothetical protein